MIKWLQIASITKSTEDFHDLVRLLEALGLRKGETTEDETTLSAEFFPAMGKIDLQYQRKGWRNVDLSVAVSDPDTALEVVSRLGFSIEKDDSGPKPTNEFRTFDVLLPGGTRLSVYGLRVVENVVDTGHLAVEGNLSAAGKNFALVVSRFNSFISERLLAGALDALMRCGANRNKSITIVRVPGAFEIPSAARTLAETGKYDAIICIGCLLRGDTLHYDVIANEVTRGIGQSVQETGVPHAFGVLTCDTLEQAIDRAGLKSGNKGFEAALAAVEMANLKRVVSRQSSVVSKKALSSQHSAFSKKKQIPRSARNDNPKKRNDKPKKVRRHPR